MQRGDGVSAQRVSETGSIPFLSAKVFGGEFDKTSRTVFRQRLFGKINQIVFEVSSPNTLAASTHVFPSLPLPQGGKGITKVTLSAQRNAWANTGSDIITTRLEVSEDSGGVWSTLVESTSGGGVVIGRNGLEIKDSEASATVAWVVNPQRLTRVTVINTTILNTKITKGVS